MNKQRTAVLICAAVGMLATFLPWAHVNVAIIETSVSGTKGDGWITLAIFAVPLVLCLAGDNKQPLSTGITAIAAIAGLVNAGIGIYKIADFNSSIGKLSGGSDDNPFGDMVSSMVKSSVSVGFGLYLLVIAGVATAICAYAIKNRPAKPQSTPPATPPVV